MNLNKTKLTPLGIILRSVGGENIEEIKREALEYEKLLVAKIMEVENLMSRISMEAQFAGSTMPREIGLRWQTEYALTESVVCKNLLVLPSEQIISYNEI